MELRKAALKHLQRMPKKQADAMVAALKKLAEKPDRADLDIRPLTGEPGFRLRIGKWRAVYLIDGEAIIVLRIRPRGDAYK